MRKGGVGGEGVAKQIGQEVQRAMGVVRSPGMAVQEEVGVAGGGGKLGDMVNRLSSVVGGLGAKSLSKAVGGMAAGAGGGAMAAGGPVMAILGTIAGILEGLAPIKAIMAVIGAILQLAFLPLSMVLMAILMPFLYPLLQILGKLPWQAIFAAIQQMQADISAALAWFVGELWAGIQDIATGVKDVISGIQEVAGWITTGITDYIQMYITIAKDMWSVLTGHLGMVSAIA